VSEITTRLAKATEEDCKAVFGLLLNMHKEVGRQALNPNKAFVELYSCVTEGAVYMVYRDDELVASAGMRMVQPWYSDEHMIGDQWFYVRKDCRDDSRVLKALLREVRQLADDAQTPVQFKLYDPARPNKSKTTTIAEDFYYKPVGKLHIAEPVTESTE
jgi:hypothetical protein